MIFIGKKIEVFPQISTHRIRLEMVGPANRRIGLPLPQLTKIPAKNVKLLIFYTGN